MQLNREKAVRIMSLMDELRAELVGTFISVEGSTTAAEEEVKQEQPKTAREFLAEIRANKTPNEQRKEVIEKAKLFIDKHDNIGFDTFTNNNKIVVFNTDTEQFGFSKCSPKDVFNHHIGYAIALGRALGLDVSEFESAVQPTEKVVGHVVEFDGYQVELKPSDTSIICEYTKGSATINSCVASAGILQNDTKAIY